MSLSRKQTNVYAKGLIAALERYPRKTNELLEAFVELLEQRRHLRYCRPILTAITDVLEERGGTIRVKAESAHPLSQHSTHVIERFFQNLPAVTHESTRTQAAPGIHLRTNTYHWDGRVTTILQQLRERLTN